MTSEYRHTPVLLAECLEYSNLKPQHTFVDATLGGAGHSFEAAKLIGSGGTLIGIDQDEVALAAARLKLGTLPDDVRPRLELVRGNFGNMDEALLSTEVPGVDAVLFDLGVSSVQIDTPSRGFSFKENGPLDMRMDPGKQTLTAAEIINTYTAADLTRIIRTYSDEKWASRIADFAVRARQNAPIETSEQLVDIIKAAIPASARRAGGHPAKRTFQALRIEVNGELDVLRSGLDAAIRWLNPGGRLVVTATTRLRTASSRKRSPSSRTDARALRICRRACAGSSRYSTSSPGSRFCRRPKKSSATLAHAAPSFA